jgi:hypothetical protein
VTNEVVANVTVGSSPEALAYDPVNGYVYASNHMQGTVSLISDGSTLSVARVDPSSAFVPTNGTQSFTAIPSCGGGSCPSGVDYVWNLNNKLGTLVVKNSSTAAFTAGPTPGTDTLFLNTTLDGVTVEASAAITVSYRLASVVVSPSSASVAKNSPQAFAASAACAGGACPAGTTYSWSLTDSLGKLNTSSGPLVTFTAGSKTGTVALLVNATLNGVTQSRSVSITITTGPGGLTILGLPLVEAIILFAVIAAAIVAWVVLEVRNRRKMAATASPQAEAEKEKTASSEEGPDGAGEGDAEPASEPSTEAKESPISRLLRPREETPQSEEMNCPHCGAVVESGNTECWKCKKSLIGPDEDEPA